MVPVSKASEKKGWARLRDGSEPEKISRKEKTFVVVSTCHECHSTLELFTTTATCNLHVSQELLSHR
eukprot:m.12650 g.12650  ORF g.12650 m.12650 type:complete len:67 (+) comp2966_c0_seq1:72-272(+)